MTGRDRVASLFKGSGFDQKRDGSGKDCEENKSSDGNEGTVDWVGDVWQDGQSD